MQIILQYPNFIYQINITLINKYIIIKINNLTYLITIGYEIFIKNVILIQRSLSPIGLREMIRWYWIKLLFFIIFSSIFISVFFNFMNRMALVVRIGHSSGIHDLKHSF